MPLKEELARRRYRMRHRFIEEREDAISQIAEAFIVPSAAMTETLACCDRGDQRGMRSALAPYEFDAFAWSGYVIVVLVEWLREHGIDPPRSRAPAIQGLLKAHDPLLCVPTAEAATLTAQLEGLMPSSDELVRYWVEFTGDNAPEAAQFMVEGWDWLTRLVRAGTRADWCVLFEG